MGCTLDAWFTHPVGETELIDQMFIWASLCSGRARVEFCNCARCRLIWKILICRLSGKGDYDMKNWKEQHAIPSIEGKELLIAKITKILSSLEER